MHETSKAVVDGNCCVLLLYIFKFNINKLFEAIYEIGIK